MESQPITPREIYQALRRQYPADIILIRGVDGYECFEEDAVKVARICNVTEGPTGDATLSLPCDLLDNYKAKLAAAGYMVLEAEIA